jgi:hypothetical protein
MKYLLLQSLLLFFMLPAHAGSFHLSWDNPDIREDGSPLLPGELTGTRITYSRQYDTFTRFVSADSTSIIVSGLRKGWWDVYLEAVSRCHVIYQGEETVFADEECFSAPTITLRVKAQ